MTTAPRYTWGFIGPTADGSSSLQTIQPEPLLPPDVVQLTRGIGISDYTPEGVEEAFTRYWACAEELVKQGAQSLTLGGVPISSQLGRDRVLRLIEETKRRTGVPGDSTNEAIIAALQRLGVTRLAVASRWADQLNRALVDYFAAFPSIPLRRITVSPGPSGGVRPTSNAGSPYPPLPAASGASTTKNTHKRSAGPGISADRGAAWEPGRRRRPPAAESPPPPKVGTPIAERKARRTGSQAPSDRRESPWRVASPARTPSARRSARAIAREELSSTR